MLVQASRRKARFRGLLIGGLTGALVVAAIAAWMAAEIGVLKQVALADIKTFQDVAAARLAITAGMRADRLFSAFRADDLRKPDRLALTTRMLRLDGDDLANGLFLFDADGRLVAATGLLAGDRAAIAAAPWFRQALGNPAADDAAAISGVTRDPLGDGRGVILYRRLVDPAGVKGIIGTFLGETALRRLLAPSGRFGAMAVTLGDGDERIMLGAEMPGAAPPAVLARLQHALHTLGLTTAVRGQAVLPRSALLWSATEDYVTAMSAADGRRLLRNAASATLGVGLAILAAFLFGRRMERRHLQALAEPERRAAEERERHLAAFDPSPAVWFWFLTQDGRVSGVGGNIPKCLEDRVYGPNGLTAEQDFARIAGHMGELPEAWERLVTAVRNGTPFTDLEVDFVLGEGRVLRLSLSGQPQSGPEGGFWGIARPAAVAPVRVEEESPAAAAALPALAKGGESSKLAA
jgi:hypothetical protein